MLDLRFIKENIVAVIKNIESRNMKSDVNLVVELYDKRNELIKQIDDLRRERNENASAVKAKVDAAVRAKLIEEGKKLKELIAKFEAEADDVLARLNEAHKRIPNMAHPEAPLGKEDKDNTEVKRVGQLPNFSFLPKDHVQLGHDLDIVDFETATKVSGTRFYYLKNEAVLLELALIRYAIDILQKHGFSISITPDIAKVEMVDGIGFNPRGPESNVYNIEGEDTCLVGTAEITLGAYYADSIVAKEKLPILMAGLSHCFRKEAGSAGQFSKGLYRVHQFTKLEMFVYCLPDDSEKWHEKLRLIEEEIFMGLKLPFRVVDTCTGDLGASAYRKWDLEAWMPGRATEQSPSGDWGEVTSTSNCTDYQSRRLNIRYKDDDGKNKFVHTLNGTAIAISRALVAILENYQQADGSVLVPDALVPYTGFSSIKSKNK